MHTTLVTNATQYAGPGIVETLVRQGTRVICHDASFDDSAARTSFRDDHAEVECLASTEPDALARELDGHVLRLDAVVLNDVHPLTPKPIGEIAPENLRDTFEAVFMFPVQLAQSLLPGMKARGAGSFVFITSAASRTWLRRTDLHSSGHHCVCIGDGP